MIFKPIIQIMKSDIFKSTAVMVITFIVAISFTSCSKDDPIVLSNPSATIILHRNDEQAVSLKSGDNISWSSNNEFVATVEDGKVTGKHVGSTTIVAQNDESRIEVPVTVTPAYFLYDDPIIEFGLTKKTLLARETHELISEVTDSTDLLYNYSKGEYAFLTGYDLDDSEKLIHTIVLGNKKDEGAFNNDELKEIAYYFAERFAYIGDDEDGYGIFINDTNLSKVTMGVHLGISKKGSLQAIYAPATVSITGSITVSTRSVVFNEPFHLSRFGKVCAFEKGSFINISQYTERDSTTEY